MTEGFGYQQDAARFSRYNLDKQLRIVRRLAKGKSPEAFVELCNQFMAGKKWTPEKRQRISALVKDRMAQQPELSEVDDQLLSAILNQIEL